MLTENEQSVMTHWSRWGSDGYPIAKRGRSWWVDGVRECGIPQVSVLEVSVSEVGVNEVVAREVGAFEVRQDVTIFITPAVPGLDALLLENFQMFFISHGSSPVRHSCRGVRPTQQVRAI